MIRSASLLCGVALLMASACAPAPAEMTEAQSAEVEASARAAFAGIMEAIAAADQEAMLADIADGAIVAFHGTVWDKAGLAGALDDFYDPVERTDMEDFAPLQFDVLGPDAVAVTSQNIQTTHYKEGMVAPVTVSTRTFVLVRGDDGVWLIQQGHISQHVMPTE